MKDDEKVEAKNVPPYVPYKTFINFIDGLRVAMPSRIDKSIMGSLSGGIQGQLIAALKYLHLIGHNDAPSDRMTRLVNSEGPEREKALRDIIQSSYSFLFKEGIDLQRATLKIVDDEFASVGASGDTIRKCVAFFLAAAKASRLPLSPYLSNIKRGPRSSAPRQKRQAPQADQTSGNGPMTGASSNEQMSWSKLLLSKFPSFDPNWSSEVQSKWFDMFEKMMASGQVQSDDFEEGEE